MQQLQTLRQKYASRGSLSTDGRKLSARARACATSNAATRRQTTVPRDTSVRRHSLSSQLSTLYVDWLVHTKQLPLDGRGTQDIGRSSEDGEQDFILVRLRYASLPTCPCCQAHNHVSSLYTGLAVRFWQLGIEMRPFHHQLWAYGIYGGLGASFGFWLQGVEDKQMRYLRDTRDRLIDKRKRRAEREGGLNIGTGYQKDQEGLFASPKVQVETGAELPGVTIEKTAAAQ